MTERLVLRRWTEADRAVFHTLNADPQIMRFFPFRRDKAAADAMMERLNRDIDREGFGFFAMEERATGQAVGFTGLARVSDALPFAPAVEVGWRLLSTRWGRGYATEAGGACLRFGFEELALAEIVSFCVVGNDASEAVMRRLGFAADGQFDHPKIDRRTHPSLVPHRLYRLGRDAWRERRAGQPLSRSER